MIDVKQEAIKMIARMRATGNAKAADHVEKAIMPLLRPSRADDDDVYREMGETLAGLTLAAIDSMNGDPFDLGTLCFSVVLLCMRHVHENTEVDGICLMRSIGQSLVEAADGIVAEAEDGDGGETAAGDDA
jgi:hypothetical protein